MTTRRREPNRCLAALVAVLLLAGCGYSAMRPVAPPGVRRVAVATFSVGQGPADLGAWLAAAVAGELVSTPDLTLASPARADAVVRGEVRLGGDESAALAATGSGPQAVLAAPWLEARAALFGRNGEVLRSVGPLRSTVLRAVAASGDDDRARESRALRDAADRLGRAVARALFDAP